MSEDLAFARVRVGPHGRVVIPAPYRTALGIKIGDTVVMRRVDGHLVLETEAEIVARIHQRFSHIPPEVSLADELIAERRLEAQREAEE